jgi:hypothetical protein
MGMVTLFVCDWCALERRVQRADDPSVVLDREGWQSVASKASIEAHAPDMLLCRECGREREIGISEAKQRRQVAS